MVATTGVLIAAIYYVYNVKNTEKTRQRDYPSIDLSSRSQSLFLNS